MTLKTTTIKMMSKVTMMLMNENTAADKECLFWMMTTTTACGSANMKKNVFIKEDERLDYHSNSNSNDFIRYLFA